MPNLALYLSYIGAAVVFSGAVVLAFGSGLAISTRLRHRVLPWTFPLIGAAVLLNTVASRRNVDLYVINPAFSFGEDSGLGVWALRACMWSILVLCAGYIVSSLFLRHHRNRAATPLYVSFMVFFSCSSLLNAAFGSVPSFDYKTLYAPLVVTAFYMGQGDSCRAPGLVCENNRGHFRIARPGRCRRLSINFYSIAL